jgi:hypothetical protein
LSTNATYSVSTTPISWRRSWWGNSRASTSAIASPHPVARSRSRTISAAGVAPDA